MKEFSLSKSETDKISSMYAILVHYQMVAQITDKAIGDYIVEEIFPRIGLSKKDYPSCRIDAGSGKIFFKEEKDAKPNAK